MEDNLRLRLKLSPEDNDLLKYDWFLNEYGSPCSALEELPFPKQLNRVVMERVLERDLCREERVKHFDKDKLNCSRENLDVFIWSQEEDVKNSVYKQVYDYYTMKYRYKNGHASRKKTRSPRSSRRK
jgi:hypothetical protein